jgi:proteic killer suppression protein
MYGAILPATLRSSRDRNLDIYDAPRYGDAVIRTFRGRETERIWRGHFSPGFPPDVQQVARRKLRMINNAQSLTDLRVPPGNVLKMLRGDRSGEHSIRINDQWRVCFIWKDGDAYDVEIADYH